VRIAADGAGGAYLVWNDARTGTTEVYAQRIDGNGVPLWDPAGVLICSATGSHRDAELAGLGANGFAVVWLDDRAGVTSRHFYAQRVDANGSRLWGAGGVPLCTAGGNRNGLNVIASGIGVLAGWADFRGGNADVYANRVVASQGVLDARPLAPGRVRLGLLSSNPTAGETRLQLELAAPASVDATVLDAQGRRVRALGAGQAFSAGAHVIRWDGADDSGAPAAAGIYLVRVRAGAETRFAKLVRVK